MESTYYERKCTELSILVHQNKLTLNPFCKIFFKHPFMWEIHSHLRIRRYSEYVEGGCAKLQALVKFVVTDSLPLSIANISIKIRQNN